MECDAMNKAETAVYEQITRLEEVEFIVFVSYLGVRYAYMLT